jgi:hypothetical protein
LLVWDRYIRRQLTQYAAPAVGHKKTNASAREGRARSKFKHDLEAIFLVRPFGNLVERSRSPFRDAPRHPSLAKCAFFFLPLNMIPVIASLTASVCLDKREGTVTCTLKVTKEPSAILGQILASSFSKLPLLSPLCDW